MSESGQSCKHSTWGHRQLTQHVPASAGIQSQRDPELPFEFAYLDYVFSNIKPGAKRSSGLGSILKRFSGPIVAWPSPHACEKHECVFISVARAAYGVQAHFQRAWRFEPT